MFRFTRQRARACLFAVFAATSLLHFPASAAPGTPADIPIESFFNNSAFSGAVLSPNAKSLAVIISPKNKRMGLYVIDLTTNQGKVVAQFNDGDVSGVS